MISTQPLRQVLVSGDDILRVTYAGGHSLYHEQKMALKDVVIQLAFRFDEGVNTITMGLEGGPTGHVMRMNFHRTSVNITRMPGVGKDAHDRVAEGRVNFQSGKWYTMVMELCGTELLVNIVESILLFGTADGIAKQIAAGDNYSAAEAAATIGKCSSGDAGKPYRDQSTELKRDPGYAIGKEYQKLATATFTTDMVGGDSDPH